MDQRAKCGKFGNPILNVSTTLLLTHMVCPLVLIMFVFYSSPPTPVLHRKNYLEMCTISSIWLLIWRLYTYSIKRGYFPLKLKMVSLCDKTFSKSAAKRYSPRPMKIQFIQQEPPLVKLDWTPVYPSISKLSTLISQTVWHLNEWQDSADFKVGKQLFRKLV